MERRPIDVPKPKRAERARAYPTAREGQVSPFEQKILTDIAEIKASRRQPSEDMSAAANAQERMRTMYTQ